VQRQRLLAERLLIRGPRPGGRALGARVLALAAPALREFGDGGIIIFVILDAGAALLLLTRRSRGLGRLGRLGRLGLGLGLGLRLLLLGTAGGQGSHIDRSHQRKHTQLKY